MGGVRLLALPCQQQAALNRCRVLKRVMLHVVDKVDALYTPTIDVF